MSEQAVDKIDTTRYSRNLRGRVWDRGLGFISVFGSARVAVGTGHAPVAGSPALRQSRSSETTPAGRQSPSSKTHPRPARVPHSETSPAPLVAVRRQANCFRNCTIGQYQGTHPRHTTLHHPYTTPITTVVGRYYSSGKFFRKLYTFPVRVQYDAYTYMSYRHIPSPTQSPNSTRFRYRTITTITETPLCCFVPCYSVTVAVTVAVTVTVTGGTTTATFAG
jgi:hypothetical protein